MERRAAVDAARVSARAGVQQQFHNPAAAASGREDERRLASAQGGVRIRSVLQQQINGPSRCASAPAEDSVEQRCGAVVRTSLQLRTIVEEESDCRHLTAGGGEVKWRLAPTMARVDVCPALKMAVNNLHIPVRGRTMKARAGGDAAPALAQDSQRHNGQGETQAGEDYPALPHPAGPPIGR
jgi:hypothetical protein